MKFSKFEKGGEAPTGSLRLLGPHAPRRPTVDGWRPTLNYAYGSYGYPA